MEFLFSACSEALGMENGDIVDSQLSSTDPWGGVCTKEKSRLNYHDSNCPVFAPAVVDQTCK